MKLNLTHVLTFKGKINLKKYIPLFILSKFFLTFIHLWETETEQGKGAERGRNRIRSRLQALNCQHRAQHRARIHKLQDHDLSRSRDAQPTEPPRRPSTYTFSWKNPHILGSHQKLSTYKKGWQTFSCSFCQGTQSNFNSV